MVIGLQVQLGRLHRAAQVAAVLKRTEVPLRNKVFPCLSATFYDRVVGRLLLSYQSYICLHSRTQNSMPVSFLQLISVGRRRYRTYHHLELRNSFRYLLESVVKTTSSKSSSHLRFAKSRLLNSPRLWGTMQLI